MRLILPIPPSANRYYRVFRGRAVKSREAREYQRLVAAGIPVSPLTGPVIVSIAVHRARRSGDLDNYGKVLLDSLRGIAYVDDRQVVELHMFRFDDPENPRVEISINEAELVDAEVAH